MKFKFLVFLFALILFAITPFKAFADENFDISTDAKYEVQKDGKTKVTQVISIENKKEFVYTPTYTVSVGFKDIEDLKAFNSSGPLQTTLKEKEDQKTIQIDFNDRVTGVGNVNRFTISFLSSDIARIKGNVLDVSIPGLVNPDSFTSYDAQVIVPQSFGPPTIIKPFKKFGTGQAYTFSKGEIGDSGIFLLFGQSQFYTLNLTYHIGNSQIVPVKTEIALPPPTSYQDVRISSLSPKPEDMYQDKDGNWLAVYRLNPREEKTIQAKVIVKIYSEPQANFGSVNKSDLLGQKYWEIADPQITTLAKELKTPRAIYSYVVNKLMYSYEKVSDNNVRLGARGVLSRSDFAVCLEFTDLFVTLARAAGIPARAVEGYAFTNNSKLRPLSFVKDVLHSWPEYYDKDLKTWIMVDPTWGNTTHGMDYFNTLDFDHITFVMNGVSSTYPVPAGGYKTNKETKDVFVEVGGEEEFINKIKSSVSAEFPENVFPGLPFSGTVIIKNEGNTPVKNKELTIESDGLTPSSQTFIIDSILPYGSKVVTVGFDKTPFLTNKRYQVTISYDGNELRKEVNISPFPNPYLIALGGIIIVGSIFVATIAYKTWSIYFSRRK